MRDWRSGGGPIAKTIASQETAGGRRGPVCSVAGTTFRRALYRRNGPAFRGRKFGRARVSWRAVVEVGGSRRSGNMRDRGGWSAFFCFNFQKMKMEGRMRAAAFRGGWCLTAEGWKAITMLMEWKRQEVRVTAKDGVDTRSVRRAVPDSSCRGWTNSCK
jgi:hypothetical protein